MESQFLNLCNMGDLDSLINEFNDKNKITGYKCNYAFKLACKNGHLLVAQWLISDVIDDYGPSFESACSNGHLLVAQWLFQIKPIIDISVYNTNICMYNSFIAACFNGHLLVAKWLLQVKPTINISANNNYAFTLACIKGNLHVALWLQSLNPYYYMFTYNEQTNKITSWTTDKLNYGVIKDRINKKLDINAEDGLSFKEALMRDRFHPRNMNKWIQWGHCEPADFD